MHPQAAAQLWREMKENNTADRNKVSVQGDGKGNQTNYIINTNWGW